MRKAFYRFFWSSWGAIRNRTADLEHDCPCCGLHLPWPQCANLSPEQMITLPQRDGRVVHQLKGVRTCPRCSHQWAAVVTIDSLEQYAVSISGVCSTLPEVSPGASDSALKPAT